ncbi:LuxR C-terminal-related transcriptional regulator [Nocardioides sp. GXQ0305]|uniref:LuxR C-terminal-related transcriptional regulator n=1 Tax=Nocardioides sp. GXQ0305 TaxID=3423912 RepID=UPI003D7C64EA
MTAVEPRATAPYPPYRRSRLQPPDATPHHLRRERLSGLLEASTAPLALLSAPAGSGKTALAAEWAHRAAGSRQVVWVGCHGRRDVDPWPEVLRGMQGERSRAADHVEQVLATAARSPSGWTVFLDGYDVRTTAAAEELERLLTCAGGDLQVVLTTRTDPVLPLHRYRLAGDLLELRAADLAFTDEEATRLLRAGGVELTPDDLHVLNQRLAGWAAGLRFVLPTLAHSPAPEALVASAVTHNGSINAFLVEEVLDAQPPALRDLILTTSVPDTLAPELMEELTGEPAAPTTLQLLRANVFLETAPDQLSGVRYVPFFRDLVRAQLAYEAPERHRRLHRTAAAWYAARGGWERVVSHLEHAGDRPDCGALLVDHLLVGRVLCERRGDPFRRLVAGTPSDGRTGAGDHLLRAATAWADGHEDGCSAHLDAARAAGTSGHGAVTVAVLETVVAGRVTDARRAEQLADRAADALAAARPRPGGPAEDIGAVLTLARAVAALRLGAVERAERLLTACLDSPTAAWSSGYRCQALAHAALLHARLGDLPRAAAEADEALAAAHEGDASTSVATPAHLARAYVAWASDDLAAARAHLAETWAHPEPLWRVAEAVVASGVARSAGEAEHARARLEAAAPAAAQAGPWATAWLDDEKAVQEEATPSLRQPSGSGGRVLEPLTPRELDVLAAMSEWLTTEEIAETLFVSVNTVRTHVRNILTKMGVSRRNAAIREAIRLGLLTSDPRELTPDRSG